MPRTEPKIVANAIASRRRKTAIKLHTCLIQCFLAETFVRLRIRGAPYPGFPVALGGTNEPHAAFRKESRTPGSAWSILQEIRVSERALCARCGIPRSPDSQALVCPGNS